MTNDDNTNYRRGVSDAISGHSPMTGMPPAYYEGFQDGSDEMAVAA